MNYFSTIVEVVGDFAEQGMVWAIFAGLFAGLLAIVVLAIDFVFRRLLTASQRGLLWGLVLIRLLLPAAPSSVLSLQNLVLWQADTSNESSPVGSGKAVIANSQAVAVPVAPMHAESTIPQTSWFASGIHLFLVNLHFVWLTVAIVVVLWTVATHWRFKLRISRVADCADTRLQRLLAECCQRASVRRQISLVISDGVSQPAVMGSLRPKLLLPADAAKLNDDQLRMVMLHELAHVRRQDIAANWLLILIRAIHWWNPIYWLAAARFRTLREQACDAFVIRHLAGQSSREYSELLLALVERDSARTGWRVTLPASMLGILSSFFRKRAVHNRLKALRYAGATHGRWYSAGVAAAIALVAISGLTDASSPEQLNEEAADAEWPPREFFCNKNWDTVVPENEELGVTREYDLQKAIDRISVDTGDREKSHGQLVLFFECLSLTNRNRWPSGFAVSGKKFAQLRPMHATYAVGDSGVIVTAPPSLQDEVVRYIEAWETSGLGQIIVESRFLTADRDIASPVGISWQYFGALSSEGQGEPFLGKHTVAPAVGVTSAVYDHSPIVVANLDEHQAKVLVVTAQADRRSNVLQAPKVTLFNGQQAMVSDVSQTPFVVGVQKLTSGVVEPRIVVIDEGIKIAVLPVQSSDRRRVRLTGRIEFSRIRKVDTATAMVNDTETTIQIPSVKRCQININSEIEDGQSMLIGWIPAIEQKEIVYVLLTARSVQVPD